MILPLSGYCRASASMWSRWGPRLSLFSGVEHRGPLAWSREWNKGNSFPLAWSSGLMVFTMLGWLGYLLYGVYFVNIPCCGCPPSLVEECLTLKVFVDLLSSGMGLRAWHLPLFLLIGSWDQSPFLPIISSLCCASYLSRSFCAAHVTEVKSESDSFSMFLSCLCFLRWMNLQYHLKLLDLVYRLIITISRSSLIFMYDRAISKETWTLKNSNYLHFRSFSSQRMHLLKWN